MVKKGEKNYAGEKTAPWLLSWLKPEQSAHNMFIS